ncbi:MAG: hypothetical protein R2788_17730 [Saprospiraceae bacterium]
MTGRSDRANTMLFLEDGRIIVAGNTHGNDGNDFAFTASYLTANTTSLQGQMEKSTWTWGFKTTLVCLLPFTSPTKC